eukprot:scaffold1809_cov228-Pinguiococcus_pyrenoidosus.AAC.18
MHVCGLVTFSTAAMVLKCEQAERTGAPQCCWGALSDRERFEKQVAGTRTNDGRFVSPPYLSGGTRHEVLLAVYAQYIHVYSSTPRPRHNSCVWTS